MSERLSQKEYSRVKARDLIIILALLSGLKQLFPEAKAVETQGSQPNVPVSSPVLTASMIEITPTPKIDIPVIVDKETLIHTVQPGENLFRIGLKHNLTVSEMAVANNLFSPFTIYTGQELIIPENGVALNQEFFPLRVIVGEPKDYQLTYKDNYKDKRFLSWFNEKSRFWTDWNGNEHQYFIPEDVFIDAKTAEKESGLPWYVLVAIGFTETGYSDGANWNPDITSPSGAQGRYQIMPFNWVFQPYEGSLYNPKLNALTAANYMFYLELGDFDDKETWIWRFTGGNYTRPCWNLHSGQAEVTWEIMQYLKSEYQYALEHVK